MSTASSHACDFVLYPDEKLLSDRIQSFIGCPSIAVTKGGRIFLGYYYGGLREPHMDNCNILIKSDDGVNWSAPVLAIPSNKDMLIHALDIQLWIAPDGALYVFWVQNDVSKSTDGVRPADIPENYPWIAVDGYDFGDFRHAMWCAICRDPDADVLTFEAPRYIGCGFLRCKPTVLDNGRWLLFNYEQISDRYAYSVSDDNGKSFSREYGAKKLATPFDEAMAYQRSDGSIRMLARTKLGFLAESVSHDGGKSFDEAFLSNIASPNTRFFISRTPSGRILLINNDSSETRINMTVYLSEDDGATWKYKRTFDTREQVSYPDVDFHGGRIYLTYDRERTGAKEILFLDFTEEDILNDRPLTPRVVKKLG